MICCAQQPLKTVVKKQRVGDAVENRQHCKTPVVCFATRCPHVVKNNQSNPVQYYRGCLVCAISSILFKKYWREAGLFGKTMRFNIRLTIVQTQLPLM
jgi:hypothetical protein